LHNTAVHSNNYDASFSPLSYHIMSELTITTGKRIKFQLIRLIRTLGLLKVADNFRFKLRQHDTADANKRFMAENPGFIPPPKDLAFDAYNHFDWSVYTKTGKLHAEFFAKTILEASSADKLTVLEWGCGPGRIIRHVPTELGERVERVCGTDYNAKTVEWCQQALDGIEIRKNELMPPLPYTDNTFDGIYNFSVFTHLSKEVQLAWAKELHRVLKPGGVMVCTTHGERYQHLLVSEEEKRKYAQGEVILQGKYVEGAKWYFAIHPPQYVKSELLADFAEVKFMGPQADYDLDQDAWLVRK